MPTDTFEELTSAVDTWADVGGKTIRLQQPEGFCNAMCKYWIALRELGLSGDESIRYFTGAVAVKAKNNFGARYEFGSAMQRQLHKDQKKHVSHFRIPGMTKTRVGHRTLGSGNISSRDDLLNLIINNPGIYFYNVYAPQGAFESGHAMAFDTRRFADHRVLYFMDPNWGLFWHDDADGTVREAYRNLFRCYWQCEYKRSKHTGGRELYSYTSRDQNQFSSMVMRPFR